MKKRFSKQFMREHKGCYSLEKLEACSFMKNKVVTLKAILLSEISLKDKFWFVIKQIASKEENIEIAINLAEIVLDIYEKQYPEDKRIRDCITAAKSYLKKQITVVRLCKVKYAANTAANTAAYATAAAASAADAAAVAYAADATADTAAYAAANAAVVAADATADTATTLSDTFSTQLFKVFINYCKTH